MKEYQLNIYGNWIPLKQVLREEKLDKQFFNKLRKEVFKNVNSKKSKRN